MRPFALLTGLAVVVLIVGCGGQEADSQPSTLTLFYEEICCSCDRTPEMTRIFDDITSLAKSDERIEMRAHDIYDASGFEALRSTAGRLGMDPLDIVTPALVVDDQVFSGEEAIQTELDRLHGR